MTDRHTLILAGCRPTPLAFYLKGLALLRIVTEQVDADARGCWLNDRFVLISALDGPGLTAFLTHDWRPTPVVAPWNGGSGFHPKDNTDGIKAVGGSTGPRLAAYRAAIQTSREVLDRLGLVEKPDKAVKAELITELRAELADEALAWIDAALTLSSDGPKFPPLLGTGGNDGRLDFSNNYMQRLADLMLPGGPQANAWLRASLFDEPGVQLTSGNAIGQFFPGASGGINAGPGFSSNSRVNPWDFVLMIEGALTFAAATTRRLGVTSGDVMSFPFSVRASSAGYSSAAGTDESDTRDELWLPLWQNPTSWREVRSVFSEGRVKVGRRNARTAVDFARAIRQLGVDRGIDAFERVGFHVRNGLSYHAVPLGRWHVHHDPGVSPLGRIEGWLERLDRACRRDDRTPASVRRARRRIDDAILSLCSRSDPEAWQDLLIALGTLESQLAASHKWTEEQGLRPVPWLRELRLSRIDDGSAEFRLALTLASRGIRARMVPVTWSEHRQPGWETEKDRGVVWRGADLVRDLCAVLLREEAERGRSSTDASPTALGARLDDLRRFIDGELDDDRIAALAHGVSLLRPLWRPSRQPAVGSDGPRPPIAWSLLALCLQRPQGETEDRPPRVPRGLVRRVTSGDLAGATRLAIQRLRVDGVALRLLNHPAARPAFSGLHEPSRRAQRIAAALAFPLSDTSRDALMATLILPQNPQES
jgi:CRISPR-associated protein Csx17